MAGVGTGAHGELAKAGRPWVLGTWLSIHGSSSVINVCCDVLLKSSIRTKPWGCMVKAKQRVHLAHDFNNLHRFNAVSTRFVSWASRVSGYKPQGIDALPP